MRAIGDAPVNAAYCIGGRSGAIRPHETQCHDLRIPADPRDTYAVVSYTGNCSRAMSAMVLFVHGIIVVLIEVVSVLSFACPHVVFQIRMAVVNASVNHTNDDVCGVMSDRPDFCRPAVLHSPQSIKHGIVGAPVRCRRSVSAEL